MWDSIREEYITTLCSQKDLAKKYGVSQAALSKRIKQYQWRAAREEYFLHRHMQGEGSPEDALFLMSVRQAGNRLALRVLDAMNREESEAMDPVQAQKWAGVLRDIASLQRSLYDIPAFGERENIRLQDKKLDMEEKKYTCADKTVQTDLRVFLPVEAFGDMA